MVANFFFFRVELNSHTDIPYPCRAQLFDGGDSLNAIDVVSGL